MAFYSDGVILGEEYVIVFFKQTQRENWENFEILFKQNDIFARKDSFGVQRSLPYLFD